MYHFNLNFDESYSTSILILNPDLNFFGIETFGYEKKVFHSLARLHRNLGNLRKSYEYYETLINKSDAPKKAWCSFLMTLKLFLMSSTLQSLPLKS